MRIGFLKLNDKAVVSGTRFWKLIFRCQPTFMSIVYGNLKLKSIEVISGNLTWKLQSLNLGKINSTIYISHDIASLVSYANIGSC